MLRKLTQADIAPLSEELMSLSEADKSFFDPHGYSIDQLTELLTHKNKFYFVHLDDKGTMVGYGMLRCWAGYELPTLGCVVWARYRNHGHGKLLVNELVEKAKELGFHGVKLTVSPKNTVAYKIYKNSGFRETEETAKDKVWMQLDLRS